MVYLETDLWTSKGVNHDYNEDIVLERDILHSKNVAANFPTNRENNKNC